MKIEVNKEEVVIRLSVDEVTDLVLERIRVGLIHGPTMTVPVTIDMKSGWWSQLRRWAAVMTYRHTVAIGREE